MSKKSKKTEGIGSKLALVIKSGKYHLGTQQCLKDLRKGEGKLLIVANNCPPLKKSEIQYYAMLSRCKFYQFNGNNIDLGRACVLLKLLLDLTPPRISLIFALLIVYTNQLPPTTTIFRVFSLRFNVKSLLWLFCVLLFVRSKKISVIGPITGIIAGLVYEIELLPIKKLLFPESVNNFCSKYVIPMLGTNQSRQSFLSTRNINRNINRNIQMLNNNQLNLNRQLGHTNVNTNRNQNQNQNQFLQNNQNNLASTEEQLLQSIIERSRNEITNSTENISTQSEEFQNNLQELIGMGFDPEKAEDALKKTQNNLTLATNILLSEN
ncbi:ribosomal protein L30 [Anaeramoeba flamelloides]|uniref:Ribosomal protein L30 n=1 Tax=Anaeramoeba flamelloides TaxID=1746091 RepID=A0ABQ8YFT6_9EUKA|nr:ribosomal protein L30 [Anaeramoeba flamelloides]